MTAFAPSGALPSPAPAPEPAEISRRVLWAVLVTLVGALLATLVWLAGRHEALQVQGALDRDTAAAADDIPKKTKYIAKATSDTIRQTRCDKKLTQKELAQKCNMDVSIIAEIERGGNCVYNASHVNKIQSVLGVKIPRA